MKIITAVVVGMLTSLTPARELVQDYDVKRKLAVTRMQNSIRAGELKDTTLKQVVRWQVDKEDCENDWLIKGTFRYGSIMVDHKNPDGFYTDYTVRLDLKTLEVLDWYVSKDVKKTDGTYGWTSKWVSVMKRSGKETK